MPQGLDVAAGTLLGMLLRGYAAGLQEERKRKMLEQQAQQLGVTLPQIEQSGFLARMLNPQSALQPLDLQQAMLDAYQKQLLAIEEERRKQELQLAREQALEKLRQQGRIQLKQTPEAKLQEELDLLRARAGLAGSQARLSETSANILDAFRKNYGGGIGSGTSSEASTDYEALPPEFSIGPGGVTIRLGVGKTPEREAREVTARKQAEPLTDEASNAISAVEGAMQGMETLIEEAYKNPHFLGPGKETATGLRERIPRGLDPLGPVDPAQSAFYNLRSWIVQRVRFALSGANSASEEKQQFEDLIAAANVSDPAVFERKMRVALDYARNVIKRRLELLRTPRSKVEIKEEPPRRRELDANEELRRDLGL